MVGDEIGMQRYIVIYKYQIVGLGMLDSQIFYSRLSYPFISMTHMTPLQIG
jgi:hypothetical protein